MLGVGVELTVDRVGVVFKRPGMLFVGLGLNHLAVPAVAYGLSQLFGLTPAVTIGFMLCACAPGGPVGAMLTQRAKGDVAFAASLLVVMTAVNAVATPGWLAALSFVPDGVSRLDLLPAVMKMVGLYLMVPLSVGIALREKRPGLADKATRALKIFTNVLFGAMFVGVAATRWKLLAQFGPAPIAAMGLTVVFGIVAGAVLGGSDPAVRTALAINSGVRSIALSLLLAGAWFTDDAVIMTVMIYGLVMLLGAFPAAVFLGKRA